MHVLAKVHAYAIATVHACIISIAHACTIAILSACTIAIVHACAMATVHECTIPMVHVPCPIELMFNEVESWMSRGRSPVKEQGALGAAGPPINKQYQFCFIHVSHDLAYSPSFPSLPFYLFLCCF